MLLDPFEYAKAFDELGYKMLSSLRAQGLPNVIGVLQDLELIASSKQSAVNYIIWLFFNNLKVKKLFQRFFESEFTQEEKFVALNNTDAKTYFNMMRTLQTINLKELAWRENRSYLMTEKVSFDPVVY